MMMDVPVATLVLISAVLLMPIVVVGTWAAIVYGITGFNDAVIWALERLERRGETGRHDVCGLGRQDGAHRHSSRGPVFH